MVSEEVRRFRPGQMFELDAQEVSKALSLYVGYRERMTNDSGVEFQVGILKDENGRLWGARVEVLTVVTFVGTLQGPVQERSRDEEESEC